MRKLCIIFLLAWFIPCLVFAGGPPTPPASYSGSVATDTIFDAAGDLVQGTGANTSAKLTTGGTAGMYLRSGGAGAANIWSTVILPNAGTAYYLPVFTSANTMGQLAASGTTGQILTAVTGAIPLWSSTLSVATFDLTLSTSSIPFPVGTAATPTTEGFTYWNSANNVLSIGNTTTATSLLGKVESAVTTNTLVKFSGTTGGVTAASTIVEDGTDLNLQAINLVTTGTITGKMKVITDDITLDATQVLGHVIVMSGGAETATLPAAAVGMNALFYASAAGVKNIDPNGTDTIVLTTAALTAGYQIESPGAVGDFIALVCLAANQWTCMGRSGTWVTHGAD